MRFIKLLFLVGFTIACSNKKPKNVQKNELLDIVKYQAKDIDSIFLLQSQLLPINRDSIKDWKIYTRFEQLLKDHQSASHKEFLNIAEEIYKESKKLKDSLRIKDIKTKGMMSRLNTLESESFRLKDMRDIPSITEAEVEQQVYKIYDVFDLISAKVNALYKQKRFEANLEFDEDFFTNDSISFDQK